MNFVVVLLLAVAVAAWFFYRNKQKTPSEDTDGTPQQITPAKTADKSQEAVENLLRTEEAITVSQGSDGNVYTICAPLFEDLYEIVAPLNDEFPTSSVAFEINEMANKILPEKIKAYLGLDEDAQRARATAFISDIAKLRQYVSDAKSVLTQAGLSKDERESMLINIKY